jgi:hypothetical protein
MKKPTLNRDGAAQAAVGIKSAIQELERRNGAKRIGDYRFGSDCRHEHVYKSRCLKCLRVVLSLLGLALAAGSAQAQGYDTYAGNAALVTTAQTEQAAQEKRSADAFRGMSLADRWDASSTGSIARRWDSNQFGSIASRWEK